MDNKEKYMEKTTVLSQFKQSATCFSCLCLRCLPINVVNCIKGNCVPDNSSVVKSCGPVTKIDCPGPYGN